MNELSIDDIIGGLGNQQFAQQRLPLLELLTNYLAEGENIEDSKLKLIFNLLLTIPIIVPPTTNEGKKIISITMSALSNATVKEESAMLLLEHLEPEESKLTKQFHFIIKKYLQYNPQAEIIEEETPDWDLLDEWQHVGSVLCNVCQSEKGRKIILNTSTGYIERIAVQIRSANVVRRRGAVGSLRSCLFDQDCHWWMLYESKVLTPILLPLVDANPFTEKDIEGMDPVLWMQAANPDKKLEPDFGIMRMLLECIILLCQRRGLREELRKRKVYPVMRNLDIKIEDEGVSEVLYEVVNFLIGDEDPSTPIDTNPLQISN